MKRSPLTPLWRLSTTLLFGGLMTTACNDTGWPDRDPVIVANVGADTLAFWPPMDYALADDFLTVEVRGLKTLYTCARVLALETTSVDSGGLRIVSVAASVELPGTPECPFSPGLDTLVETTAPAAGRTLLLRTPTGLRTDSLVSISGTGVVESFLHPTSATDTLRTFNRYTFRDSTSGHPRRILYTDSLATCELIQAAVFRRLHGGDTLSVSFRTLLANPALPDTSFPACAGPHADTVNVVENRYGFP